MKNTIKKHSTLICLLAYLLIYLFPPSASSLTMSNDKLNLQINNLDMNPNKPILTPHPITGEQLPTGNDHITTGFKYLPQNAEFSFSLSGTQIDFGIVSPTNPGTRDSTISITNQSSPGYQITAYQNHQLLIPPKEPVIPDTTCDNGSCSETTSALWTNTLTYGFGYRCDNLSGAGCSSGFKMPNYYKQFSDDSESESPQAIITGNLSTNTQSKITYKLNINNNQPKGTYTNNIIYIASPSF